MNRANEYIGRQLALMGCVGKINKAINLHDFQNNQLIDQALNFDIENYKDLENYDLYKNLSEAWASIFNFKESSKIWASDILAAYQKGKRDLFVHSFLNKTEIKYNEIGFFEDEFEKAKQGALILSENRYRALELIFNLEKDKIFTREKILALYRIFIKYADYKDLKRLSNRWLLNYSISDILQEKLDLANIDWEYKDI